jgi:all-trans-retinol 13,14-reductase
LPASAVPPPVKKKIDGYEMAPGIAVLYLGVKREALGDAGLANTNYWVVPNDDVDQDYTAIREGRFADQPTVGITLSSNKDPTQQLAPDGVMNLQVMALAPSNRKVWGIEAEGPGYRKNATYLAPKKELRERLLRAARLVFPNLDAGLVFEEMATPLTHARYTLSTNGTPYGIAATPKQFDVGRPGAVTHLPGLLLAGASCRNTHGVVGAIQSGREAALAGMKLLGRG